MYEFHGWALIRQSTAEVDEDRIDAIARTLREHIAALNWDTGALELRAVNGEYQLWVAGLDNHAPQGRHNPVEIFRYAAKIAPGSYGLLYIWDNEDQDGWQNEFQVYVLARGEVYRRKDPFLSPCIPVIEDEADSPA